MLSLSEAAFNAAMWGMIYVGVAESQVSGTGEETPDTSNLIRIELTFAGTISVWPQETSVTWALRALDLKVLVLLPTSFVRPRTVRGHASEHARGLA